MFIIYVLFVEKLSQYQHELYYEHFLDFKLTKFQQKLCTYHVAVINLLKNFLDKRETLLFISNFSHQVWTLSNFQINPFTQSLETFPNLPKHFLNRF